MSTAIQATGLGKRFGSVWALQRCSLRIPVGRVVALVGPNGAGKTTFLRLAAGLDAPTAGQIEVLGRSPQDQLTLVLPRVGFLAQDRPTYEQFAVRDLFELGRRLNPRWDGARARARVERYSIPLDRPMGKLSGGQQAQVALAMALGKRPELLLLDEPLSGLDPLARREVLQNLMEAVSDGGLSVVLSSHIVSELERTCDYLVILSLGQVQVSGAIEDLLNQHRLLVGPRLHDGIGRDPAVIACSQAPAETTVLVHLDGRHWGAEWESHDVNLEDLVLAYLGRPEAGVMPVPEVIGAGSQAP